MHLANVLADMLIVKVIALLATGVQVYLHVRAEKLALRRGHTVVRAG